MQPKDGASYYQKAPSVPQHTHANQQSTEMRIVRNCTAMTGEYPTYQGLARLDSPARQERAEGDDGIQVGSN